MLATLPHLYRTVLNPLPPVPSREPLYLGTLTSTADEASTIWPDVNIGEPHPKRVVILATYQGQTNTPTATIQGLTAARGSVCWE